MLIFYIIFIQIFLIHLTIAYENEYEDRDKSDMVPHHHSRTPRLEDFFWTGSGDGPPPPDLSAPLPSPSTPLIKTTTVLATVYLDSYPPQAVTDSTSGECITNCEVTPDSLEPEIPEDRRYWLLTVIQGSTPDSLQLKLARLYQKAFLRQQERHLGIIKSLDAPTRKKHDVHSFVVNKVNEFKQTNTNTAKNPVKLYEIESSTLDDLGVNTFIYKSDNATDSYNNSEYSKHLENIEVFSISKADIEATKASQVDSWFLVTPTVVHKRSVDEIVLNDKEDLIDLPLEDDSNETVLFKREIIKPEQQPPVHVHIQNITESTGSVQIVYVVLVGGRAVPAAVAARDMRLVRDAEVATELGAIVTTKAEPYLQPAAGLEAAGTDRADVWPLVAGAALAVALLLLLFMLLCFAHRRRKQMKSAATIRAYHHEMMMEAERKQMKQMKQINDEKDGKLVSVVSPSRTRPSSVLLPVYRTGSASGRSSSSSSSGVSELAAALRRRRKKPHALRIAHKKRVGTTDSLLQSAGVDSSEAGSPPTPTSYLSMPSVNAFPRGNMVEPLSKILEPISVRHLDLDSPSSTPKRSKESVPKRSEVVPRRQMTSQLVRLGSIDKDPGVIGPLVWDLHCQRIKDSSKPSSPAPSKPGSSRMRQRFNDLMDDAYTLFGSASSSTDKRNTDTVPELVTQACNDEVRIPTTRGSSAGHSSRAASQSASRSRSAVPRSARPPPAAAWSDTPTSTNRVPQVNPSLITAEGRLDQSDPALPIIAAIQTEIKRVRDNATKN